jgi:pyruvate/2-oxoglutarate dehydrogenase complex dihydrolipoamide dehydrogenase (E3) component
MWQARVSVAEAQLLGTCIAKGKLPTKLMRRPQAVTQMLWETKKMRPGLKGIRMKQSQTVTQLQVVMQAKLFGGWKNESANAFRKYWMHTPEFQNVN